MEKRIFNSTLYLLSAFFIVHLSRIFVQYFFIKILNLEKAMMYFFYNSYLAPDIKWWSRLKVFLVSGTATIITLIMFFVFLILFLKLSRKKYKLNVFYNWLILVSISFFIADFFAAPFFKEISPIFNVLRWFNFANGGGGMYFIALILLPLIPVVAYLSNRNFIKMANTTKWLKTRPLRMKFYIFNALIPYIVLLLVLFGMIFSVYNYNYHFALCNEGMRMSILGAILLFGMFFSYNKKYISIQKSNDTHKINFSQTIFMIVVMISSFVILWFNLS